MGTSGTITATANPEIVRRITKGAPQIATEVMEAEGSTVGVVSVVEDTAENMEVHLGEQIGDMTILNRGIPSRGIGIEDVKFVSCQSLDIFRYTSKYEGTIDLQKT